MKLGIIDLLILFLLFIIASVTGNYLYDYFMYKELNSQLTKISIQPPVIKKQLNNINSKKPNYYTTVKPVMNKSDLCLFWVEHLAKRDNTRNRELKRRACNE